MSENEKIKGTVNVGALIVGFAIFTVAGNSWSILHPDLSQPPGMQTSMGGVDFLDPIMFVFALIGFGIMLGDGFARLYNSNEKSRHAWWILIFLGMLYAFSFFGHFKDFLDGSLWIIYIPSLTAILGGSLLKAISNKRSTIPNSNSVEDT